MIALKWGNFHIKRMGVLVKAFRSKIVVLVHFRVFGLKRSTVGAFVVCLFRVLSYKINLEYYDRT